MTLLLFLRLLWHAQRHFKSLLHVQEEKWEQLNMCSRGNINPKLHETLDQHETPRQEDFLLLLLCKVVAAVQLLGERSYGNSLHRSSLLPDIVQPFKVAFSKTKVQLLEQCELLQEETRSSCPK